MFLTLPLKENAGTAGEIRRVIVDTIVHPATKNRPEFWALDTFLHGLVEQNPEVTLRKFVKYTLPKPLKDAIREKK